MGGETGFFFKCADEIVMTQSGFGSQVGDADFFCKMFIDVGYDFFRRVGITMGTFFRTTAPVWNGL